MFPYVVLQRGLLFSAELSQTLDVVYNSRIHTLQVQSVHAEEAIECLTKEECWEIDRVLAFIHEVEHLADDWIFDEPIHFHLLHDVEGVHGLSQVEDWLHHKLVHLSNMILFAQILIKRLFNKLVYLLAFG